MLHRSAAHHRGEYKGKDDPVAMVRSQGIFPAPEEIVSPYLVAHFVAGDARGSRYMPIMPAAINTAITGPYCLPVVSTPSDSRPSLLIEYAMHVFGNPVWGATRLMAQHKADEIRRQGFVGAAMLPMQELE